MPWRYVGLQDDQDGDGVRRARITEEGALVVSVAGGGGGGGGGTDVVTLGGIDTTDQLQVSLADISTTDELSVSIKSTTGTLPVQIENASPLPVSLSGQPVSVTIASTPVNSMGPNAASAFGGNPGAVTAPAADALITNVYPATASRLHLIEVTAWLSEGTPLAADSYNMAFKFGGTVISKIPVLAAVNMPITSRFYYMSAAATPFGIHAIAAGSSGVRYNAFLTATRLA